MPRRLIALLCLFMLIYCQPLAPALAQSDPQEALSAYFDGTVFVGDSIMQQIGRFKLEQAERGRQMLGQARFLTLSSYTLYQGSRITPLEHKAAFRMGGERISLSKALYRMGARRAFILLGMNDQAGDRLKNDLKMYDRLIDLTLKQNPDLQLIALSVTPIMRRAQTKALNQKNFDAFNEGLEELCQQKGVKYLDVATALKDENGFLRADYASDNRVHLSREGMEAFIETITAYAQAESAAP